MPLYDYHCDSCGDFTALRKMSESSLPAPCEFCGDSSLRVITAPNFALLGKAQRAAHERNEKSAHEPRSVRRSSCGCTGAHSCKPASDNSKVQAKTDNPVPALQMQTKRSARPWMLGH